MPPPPDTPAEPLAMEHSQKHRDDAQTAPSTKVTKSKKESTNAIKDKLFIGLCVVVLLLSIQYFLSLYRGLQNTKRVDQYKLDHFIFRTDRGETYSPGSYEELQKIFDAYRWPALGDLKIAFLSAFVIYNIKKLTKPSLDAYYLSVSTAKPERRLAMAEKNTYNLQIGVYYVILCTFGLAILQKSDFLPWYLFQFNTDSPDGSHIDNIYRNFPLVELPTYLHEYYMITLGFHIQKAYQDLFLRKRTNDIFEVLLHHLLTFELYLGSYFLNYITIGSVILFVFDFTEIFVSLSKATLETKHSVLVGVFGFLMWFFWIYIRLVCYPIIYIRGLLYLPDQDIPNYRSDLRSDERFVITIYFILCTFMEILNVWWAYLITKMLWKFAVKGKTKDIQEKVE